MATGTSGSSNGFLYFIVGALVVGVIVLGVMFFNERNDSPPGKRRKGRQRGRR